MNAHVSILLGYTSLLAPAWACVACAGWFTLLVPGVGEREHQGLAGCLPAGQKHTQAFPNVLKHHEPAQAAGQSVAGGSCAGLPGTARCNLRGWVQGPNTLPSMAAHLPTGDVEWYFEV